MPALIANIPEQLDISQWEDYLSWAQSYAQAGNDTALRLTLLAQVPEQYKFSHDEVNTIVAAINDHAEILDGLSSQDAQTLVDALESSIRDGAANSVTLNSLNLALNDLEIPDIEGLTAAIQNAEDLANAAQVDADLAQADADTANALSAANEIDITALQADIRDKRYDVVTNADATILASDFHEGEHRVSVDTTSNDVTITYPEGLAVDTGILVAHTAGQNVLTVIVNDGQTEVMRRFDGASDASGAVTIDGYGWCYWQKATSTRWDMLEAQAFES